VTTLIPLTNFPQGFNNGVTLRNLPILNTYSGPVYWVDSNGPGGTYKGTYARPFLTVAAALAAIPATQNNVTIMIKSGHTETISAAGGWTISNTGVRILGLGVGSERPQITFSTSTGASVLVSAAGCTIGNIIGIAGINALTNPFNIQAADCTLDIEWRDVSAAQGAVRAILANASASNLNINLLYKGFLAGTAGVNGIRLIGVSGCRINIDYFGNASTAVVELNTTACSNIQVNGRSQNAASSNFSAIVVDSAGGSNWFLQIYEVTSGLWVDGSSANGLSTPDLQNFRPLTVTANFTQSAWNTIGAHRVFTTSGLVEMYLTPVVTGSLTSSGGATLTLGDTTTTNILVASTNYTALTANLIWSATTPVSSYVGGSTIGALHIVTSSPNNIGYTVGTAALTGGSIAFNALWRPITIGSTVVAATGGAL